DAEADFRAALDLRPGPDLRYALLVNRGVVRFEHKRLGDAVDDFRAAIEREPRRYNAYVNLAGVDHELGRRDEALALLGRAIDLRGDLASLYRMRAFWRWEGRERDAALADLDLALRYEEPDSPEAAKDRALRGNLLYLAGRYAEALEACDAAIR